MSTKREEADRLRARLEELNRECDRTAELIQRIEGSCVHQWGEPTKHMVVENELVQSHENGHWRGVDFIPGLSVSEKRSPAWSRVCSQCGKKEVTKNTQSVVKTEVSPKFD